jgi:hypothetical protein
MPRESPLCSRSSGTIHRTTKGTFHRFRSHGCAVEATPALKAHAALVKRTLDAAGVTIS